jgi:hypothetical protein
MIKPAGLMSLAFVLAPDMLMLLREGIMEVNGLRSYDVGQGDGEVSKNDRGSSGTSTYINMHEYINSQVEIECKPLNYSKTQVHLVLSNHSWSVRSGNLENFTSRRTHSLYKP